MTRIQLAGFALIASACILAGMLLSGVGSIEQKAQAELVLNKDTLTMLTTQVRDGDEALFVIDSLNESLLIYKMNFGRKKIELAERVDLKRLFSGAAGAAAAPAGNPGRVPR